MSSSVRYVGMEEHGVSVKPALGVRGTKYATCVINDGETIRAVQVPLKEFDKYQPVSYHGRPYPVERFTETMMAMTKRRVNRMQITQAALDAIERARTGGTDEPEAPAAPQPKAPVGRPQVDAPTLLGRICAELGIDPAAARRQLRKAGLKAPYQDEKEIRNILK